jgi:quercetin dioxygenase-like cupin family protein
MKITRPGIAYTDERGDITDVLVDTDFNYATLITSKKGVVRGNHYHEKTVQWVYLLSGRLRSLAQRRGEKVEEAILNPGDLLENEPGEAHTLIALEDARFLVLTRGLRGGADYEKDTYRLARPLEELV